MPTPGVISRAGMADGIPGMAHLTPVPSPMARRVEDLLVTGNVLAEHPGTASTGYDCPRPTPCGICGWPVGRRATRFQFRRRSLEPLNLPRRRLSIVERLWWNSIPLRSRSCCGTSSPCGWPTERSRFDRQVRGRAVDPSLKRMITSGRLPRAGASIAHVEAASARRLRDCRID